MKPELVIQYLLVRRLAPRADPRQGSAEKHLPRELRGRRPQDGGPRSDAGQAWQMDEKRERWTRLSPMMVTERILCNKINVKNICVSEMIDITMS